MPFIAEYHRDLSEPRVHIQRATVSSSLGGGPPSPAPIFHEAVVTSIPPMPQTPRRNRAGVFVTSVPSTSQTPQRRNRNEPVTTPVSHTTPQRNSQESAFMPPDEMALWLELNDEGPPYYVVTHGREPGIYTDW
jgi:hypothetical protein